MLTYLEGKNIISVNLKKEILINHFIKIIFPQENTNLTLKTKLLLIFLLDPEFFTLYVEKNNLFLMSAVLICLVFIWKRMKQKNTKVSCFHNSFLIHIIKTHKRKSLSENAYTLFQLHASIIQVCFSLHVAPLPLKKKDGFHH